MNIERILVPYDFSDCSAAALDYAARLASPNSRLFVVHVDELVDARISAIPSTSLPFGQNSSWDRRHNDVMSRLAKIVPHGTVTEFENHCLAGFPPDEILSFAARIRADLIVMGSHGRTGLSRFLTGSVAELVMRRSQCPVLIVKSAKANSEAQGAVLAKGAAQAVADE